MELKGLNREERAVEILKVAFRLIRIVDDVVVLNSLERLSSEVFCLVDTSISESIRQGSKPVSSALVPSCNAAIFHDERDAPEDRDGDEGEGIGGEGWKDGLGEADEPRVPKAGGEGGEAPAENQGASDIESPEGHGHDSFEGGGHPGKWDDFFFDDDGTLILKFEVIRGRKEVIEDVDEVFVGGDVGPSVELDEGRQDPRFVDIPFARGCILGRIEEGTELIRRQNASRESCLLRDGLELVVLVVDIRIPVAEDDAEDGVRNPHLDLIVDVATTGAVVRSIRHTSKVHARR